MAAGATAPDPRLAEKLNEIIRGEGGLNLVADVAGVSASSLSRRASGRGGVSRATAARLEDAYGARYNFTARQLLEWSLGTAPEAGGAPPDPVPPDVRVYWSRVQDEYGPEEREVARAMDRLAQRAAEDFRNRRRALGLPSKGYAPPADLGA